MWIVLVLLIRLILSFLPPMAIDQGAWRAWSARMAEFGPAKFYSTEVFTDNPPGFLYIFWFLGEVKNKLLPNVSYTSPGFDFLLKLPNNLADLGTGWLIYLLIKRKRSDSWAKAGFLLYTLNPSVIFNTSIFGQFDGSGTLFAVLAVYALVVYKRPELTGLFFAISWAIKPQTIALAPALGLLILISSKPIKWILTGLSFLGTTLLIYWPFFPTNPISGIFQISERMVKLYTCTTCFAFNFWGLFDNWRNDTNPFLGLPLVGWGMILLGLSYIFILFRRPFSKHYREPYLYTTIALSVLAFFNFLTRMHERYVFSFFAFFLLGAMLLKSKKLLAFYLFFSLFNTLNIYFPYATYTTELKLTPDLLKWLSQNFRWLSGIGFASFLILFVGIEKIISTPSRQSNLQKA
ncbi:MAG: hypothetical protein UX80_C0007G0006 [Candidatus Amesbacteria bacterium GW2011_GWA2_47_11b]|uniref:Glycosyltransferase RgtA/B/C/D-like domain-containing protein n=3 Tax=Candidatus Amesiibacteriota TaxID=1752730 RepID=A0A0G1SKP8_9BACT|nr:MAG: hypothetical protein UX42_C0005G0005 [Microgenomates group bacterium GW2011_GWC1_46_20]KKU57977.1 MAG: hypothetical protein UX80_C0007G0006 [Candidatus Amesbacteria bacterium GW2011_GWA2_47_11b]KKU69996.1 MAG: hypothetical protein UX92_C0006G0043 [Candidatus Amesbacteria bacterium GW2011_GWA1_47_20]KKU84867.1 MAG: hypothetical protein UY11_C0002G0022 [Candidatus Amesbacteria bacterium GW2011_GWC2_47_8]